MQGTLPESRLKCGRKESSCYFSFFSERFHWLAGFKFSKRKKENKRKAVPTMNILFNHLFSVKFFCLFFFFTFFLLSRYF